MSKKIGIIVGSLRKESFSKKVANNIIDMFNEEYVPEFIDVSKLEVYNQDFDDYNKVPKSYNDFRKAISSIDGAIFVTPEYNRSLPAVLKNALDVASRPFGENLWNEKPAGIISCSPGGLSGFAANHHLRQSLVFLNMPMVLQPEIYLGSVHTLLNDKGIIENEGTLKFLQSFIDTFTHLMDINSK